MASRRDVSLLDGHAGAKIEDARHGAEVAQLAQEILGFVQEDTCFSQSAKSPLRAPQREAACGREEIGPLADEEAVARLRDLDGTFRLVNQEICLADAIPGQPAGKVALVHLVADRDGLLVMGQRLSWLPNRAAHLTKIQIGKDQPRPIARFSVQRDALLVERLRAVVAA